MEEKWEKLGLKAGLECHQQLDTGKLFCRCPSVLREEKPDIVVKRFLRPVASELGEFDKAALEAFGKGLSYAYEAYHGTNCEIELDDEPPQPPDREALETTLKVALMAKAQILDELFVMRKLVIDGSNTSGFQRTVLVALGGELELCQKKVGIQTIALEEDAARPMEKGDDETVYRLDRLGIPLIELATAPDLKTPEEVKECAQKIGELFRRTCRAKRGLGTIRQDLNISISGGARVEIKGVQELEMIDEYVRREVQRQVSLVEIREEMRKRKISEKDFQENEIFELSGIFSGSECKFLRGKIVFGAKLHKMQGLLGKELQPGRRFGAELAGYVKAKARLKGILHSDELPAYGVSEREIEHVGHKCGCIMNDAFAIVQADREKAEKAIGAVLERCSEALRGVPEETRNALEDANTEYSRPLPGAARMYPETDLEPVKVEAENVSSLARRLPLTVKQREKLYREKGLSVNLVEGMKLSNHACFFEGLLKKGANATTAATLILEGLTQLRREGTDRVSDSMVESALLLESEKKIHRGMLLEFIRQWAKKPGARPEEVLRGMNIGNAGEGELRSVIRGIIEKNSALIREKGERALGALMEDAMRELRGKASGEEISRILREEIGKSEKSN